MEVRMPRSHHPSVPDRRRFLKTMGLAGLSSALAPTVLAMAQSASPPGTPSPAKADPTTAPAPTTPAEISDEARSLAEIVRRRYGKHLTEDQLEAVTRELDSRVQGGKRLRESKLGNADEPDFTFHA
jgi:hypothetical protein